MRKCRLLTLAILVAIVFLLSVAGPVLAEQERITSFECNHGQSGWVDAGREHHKGRRDR